MRDPTRQTERLKAIRLRYTINTLLEDLGLPIRALVERPEVLAPAARLPPSSAARKLASAGATWV
jgi:hypothetical protein